MKRSGMMAGVVAAAVMIGCTTMTPQQQGTVSGAAIGAAIRTERVLYAAPSSSAHVFSLRF